MGLKIAYEKITRAFINEVNQPKTKENAWIQNINFFEKFIE